MSIDETLDDETIEIMRKAVAANSPEQRQTLRRFVTGLIAFPALRREGTLQVVLTFLDEVPDESPDD